MVLFRIVKKKKKKKKKLLIALAMAEQNAAARLLGLRGSNPAGGMEVCLLWVLCDVR